MQKCVKPSNQATQSSAPASRTQTNETALGRPQAVSGRAGGFVKDASLSRRTVGLASQPNCLQAPRIKVEVRSSSGIPVCRFLRPHFVNSHSPGQFHTQGAHSDIELVHRIFVISERSVEPPWGGVGSGVGPHLSERPAFSFRANGSRSIGGLDDAPVSVGDAACNLKIVNT